MKDEVLKIMPVQKQTRAGQRTRFKAFVAIGDYNGHVGLGVKCSKEVATAIRGAIILAKLSIIPGKFCLNFIQFMLQKRATFFNFELKFFERKRFFNDDLLTDVITQRE